MNLESQIPPLKQYTASNIGKKGVSDKDVEQSVRFAYHITDYKQTNLYKNTQAWASEKACILYKI